MIVTKNWIESNYNKFNELYWNGELPTVEFKVSRSRNTWGFASFRYDYENNTIIPQALTISNYYDSPEIVKLTTLLHEMIHIADYAFHPEHFIKNGRPVSARHYNAHGYWFMHEARRINEYGWNVTNIITKEECKASRISDKEKKALDNKKKNALFCVIYGTDCNFAFKTDRHKVSTVKNTINNYVFMNIGDIERVVYYSFNNTSLARRNSCSRNLIGWFMTNEETNARLKKIKAKEVKF